MRKFLFFLEVLLIVLALHVRLGDPVPLLRSIGVIPMPEVDMGTLPSAGDLSAALGSLFPKGKVDPSSPGSLKGPASLGGITTWQVMGTDGKPAGSLVSSSPLCDKITGYGGPVPLLIGLDASGVILGTHPFRHSESDAFVNLVRARGIFSAFNGKSVADASNLRVDTVSGATMTSSTVVKSVGMVAARMAGAAPPGKGLENGPGSEPQGTTVAFLGKGAAWIVLLFGLLSCLWPSTLAKRRVLLLTASVLVIGFWQGSVLSSQVLSGWVQKGIPFAGAAFLATAFLLTLALFVRRNQSFYCFFVCPYGALQELAAKAGLKNKRVQEMINLAAPWTRPAMLAAFIGAIVLFPGTDLTGAEPFSAFLPASAPSTALALAIFFLILSAMANRPWCKGFCPVGQVLDFLGSGIHGEGRSAKGVASHEISNTDNDERKRDSEMTGHQITNILLAAALVVLLVKPHLPIHDSGTAPAAGADTLSVIHSRTSVRNYTPRTVEPEKLDKLVRAGLAAPTAADKRPWDFVVITDRKVLDSIADALEYGKMLKKANAAIVVCGNLEKALPDEAADFWIQDCSAASENILLAAEALGLGAVWVGIHPMADRVRAVSGILGCPSTRIPLNVIPVGYPDGTFKPKDKYDPKVIHIDRW